MGAAAVEQTNPFHNSLLYSLLLLPLVELLQRDLQIGLAKDESLARRETGEFRNRPGIRELLVCSQIAIRR
jgi:hypothetical protein